MRSSTKYTVDETLIAELVAEHFADEGAPPLDVTRAQVTVMHDRVTGLFEIVVSAPLDLH